MGHGSEAFYTIPIEELELSEATIALVKQLGITSVGDCIDFFARIDDGGDAGCGHPLGFFEAMINEVKPKLEEHGFYPIDEVKD